MRMRLLMAASALAAVCPNLPASETLPADTYFSLAVTENSRSHYGENLLFLDFRESPSEEPPGPRTVVSPRVAAGSITVDGQADDWDLSRLTRVRGRVMNNYPLSESYDAMPADILVGSAHDDEHIYFVVRFEDANGDASVNRRRWVYQGGKWRTMPHQKPRPGTRTARAINRDDPITNKEDEDHVMLMFPISDSEGHFRDRGLGCGGYCHANLAISAGPTKGPIGDVMAAMHTSYPDDVADVWNWMSTRTLPAGTLEDSHLIYGEESYKGRKPDPGDPAYQFNAASKPFRPAYVDREAYLAGSYDTPGYSTPLLTPDNIMPLTPEMSFAEGASLPFYVVQQSTGSRGDVTAAAHFDPDTAEWTVEFRRALTTTDTMDRQFVPGKDARPPTVSQARSGDPERGAKLFEEKACASCHGDDGEGVFEDGDWSFPRNQRTSAPAIRGAASPLRPKRLLALSHTLQREEEPPMDRLMPHIPLGAQEAEDIAAWLQQRFIPLGK